MLAQEPPPKLGAAEIERQLQTLPNWTIANHQLRRTYQFQDFVEAMAFVNRLVEPAESAGHHPDITISYNRVAISLTTHDVGGITQKDFDLAQVIARVAEQL
ncbi:MAG: 4a-hydroxytetrahydrobiopterin dehydratase [Cyanophyceae cyanobacterium]